MSFTVLKMRFDKVFYFYICFQLAGHTVCVFVCVYMCVRVKEREFACGERG